MNAEAHTEVMARAVATLRRGVTSIKTYDEWDIAKAKVIDCHDLRLSHIGVAVAADEQVLLPVWENALFIYRVMFTDKSGWYTNLTHVGFKPEEDGWTMLVRHFTVSDSDPHDAKILNVCSVLRIGSDGLATGYVVGECDINGVVGKLVKDEDDLAEFQRDELTKRMFVPLFAYNLLNCSNVILVDEPSRSRSLARRIARTGVTLSEIHVLRQGTTRKSSSATTAPAGSTRLHSVRGHTARYGVEGRGLLFGRIAGRFWIPQHVRGDSAYGEVEQIYRVDT